MADPWLMATGVFFDQDQMRLYNGSRREYFGPFAYKVYDTTVGASQTLSDMAATNTLTPSTFWSVDWAGFPDGYASESWFATVKQRWASNSYGLHKYLVKPYVRTDVTGAELKPYEHFPLYFRAAVFEDGFWSAPYFDCNLLNDWVITYSVPFFGLSKDKLASGLQFMYDFSSVIALFFLFQYF